MKNIREISLLLAGSILSITFTKYEGLFTTFGWTVLFFCLIFVGVGLLHWLLSIIIYVIAKINTWHNRIAIYAPYELDTDSSSWVDISLRQLSLQLKRAKSKFIRIYSYRLFALFPVILNPYGGTYPENNITSFESLEKIFSYVKRGGIYINISDIPFYFAYDINLNRRIDTTPIVNGLQPYRSFRDTLIARKLNLKVYANSISTRVISLEEGVINLSSKAINVVDPADNNTYSCTDNMAVPFGKGYFVFSTAPLSKASLKLLPKTVKQALDLVR